MLLRGVEALTASERRIAELAADGLTNREIAQTLFVTTRTVEGHLTNVFNKLDVKTRTGLAAALATPTQASAPNPGTGTPLKIQGGQRGVHTVRRLMPRIDHEMSVYQAASEVRLHVLHRKPATTQPKMRY